MAPLSRAPTVRVRTLIELIGVANAIEIEAARHYRRLAAEMRRAGEDGTADAFDAMESQIAAVADWARGRGETVPAADAFRERLPADLTESWEAVSGSALLTPYRAYAIAVGNAERAFAFYAYLAASAADATLAREAEALAKEKLRHAALLRTWRRAAWRRQPRETARVPPQRESLAELVRLVQTAEAEIAACHRLLGKRLRGLGDDVSADLLIALADEATARAKASVPQFRGAEASTSEQPVALLRAAQRPLELLSEELESTLLAAPDEAMQAAAQEALAHVVARIARVGQRIGALSPGRQTGAAGSLSG
jgi:rubrerythrin